MAMLLLMALRGNVFVYQGEELGLPQADVPFDRLVDPEAIANWPETLGRDGARTPMPWKSGRRPTAASRRPSPGCCGPAPPAAGRRPPGHGPGLDVNGTRRLIALRSREPALRLGSLRFLDAPGPLLAFERTHGDDTLTCVFNLGHETVDWRSRGAADVLVCVNPDLAADGALPPLSGLISRRAAI